MKIQAYLICETSKLSSFVYMQQFSSTCLEEYHSHNALFPREAALGYRVLKKRDLQCCLSDFHLMEVGPDSMKVMVYLWGFIRYIRYGHLFSLMALLQETNHGISSLLLTKYKNLKNYNLKEALIE